MYLDLDGESLGLLAVTKSLPGHQLYELHLCNAAAAAVADMEAGLAALLAACGPTLGKLVLDTFDTLDLGAVGLHCRNKHCATTMSICTYIT